MNVFRYVIGNFFNCSLSLFILERETERVSRGGAEREEERGKQALHCQHGA